MDSPEATTNRDQPLLKRNVQLHQTQGLVRQHHVQPDRIAHVNKSNRLAIIVPLSRKSPRARKLSSQRIDVVWNVRKLRVKIEKRKVVVEILKVGRIAFPDNSLTPV
jgi:hypothetical protein